MVGWTLTFFLLTVISGVLGFTGIFGAAAGFAKISFFIFLILLMAKSVFSALHRRPPI